MQYFLYSFIFSGSFHPISGFFEILCAEMDKEEMNYRKIDKSCIDEFNILQLDFIYLLSEISFSSAILIQLLLGKK